MHGGLTMAQLQLTAEDQRWLVDMHISPFDVPVLQWSGARQSEALPVVEAPSPDVEHVACNQVIDGLPEAYAHLEQEQANTLVEMRRVRRLMWFAIAGAVLYGVYAKCVLMGWIR